MTLVANITPQGSSTYQEFITNNGNNLIFPENTDLENVEFVKENGNLIINFGDSSFVLTDFDFENAKNNLNNIFVVGQPDESTPLKTITVDYRIYINLSDEQIYDASLASSYKQLITGIGTVVNATTDTIIYMGDDCDDYATCVGNDITFTNGDTSNITIKDFFNDEGKIVFESNLCVDGHTYMEHYEHVALNDKTLTVNGRAIFNNVITQEHEADEQHDKPYTTEHNIFANVIINGINGVEGEYITGSGNDTIVSGTEMTAIDAGDGDDVIMTNGYSGIIAGKGDDRIIINDGSKMQFLSYQDEGFGNDTIIGASNNTLLQFVVLEGEGESQSISGYDVDDLMFYKKGDDLHIYTMYDEQKYPLEEDYIKIKDFFTAEKPFDNFMAKYHDVDEEGPYTSFDMFSIKNDINMNHDDTNYFKGTKYADVIDLNTGLTTAVNIENLSQDTDGKVIKNEITQKYTYVSDFDGSTVNLDAYAQGGDNDDIISGSNGNDYIKGGSGYDSLYGEAGDDILVADKLDYINGGKGSDTIILKGGYNDIEIEQEDDNFRELIIGSSSTDTIILTEYNSNELTFQLQEEVIGDNTYESLFITTNKLGSNNGTIIIRDYLNSESKIDRIITADYDESNPLSIKSHILRNVYIQDGETFDKSQSEYADKKINIIILDNMANVTILNLDKSDNIEIGGNISLSRTYDGTEANNNNLIISNGSQTINVTNFGFDGTHDFAINNNSTSHLPINVTASKNYTGTSYKEIIKAVGEIEVEFDPDNDKLLFSGETKYTQTGTKRFEITDENNTVKIVQDTNLNTITPASVGTFGNNTADNLSQKTLYMTGVSNFEAGDDFKFKNVNITGTNGEDVYVGTKYSDIINGGAGDDDISNNGGNDIIYTGTGNDEIFLSGGRCQVHVDGAGVKTIHGSDSTRGHDYILSTGSAKFVSYNANDRIHFSTFDFSKIEFVRGEGENENDLLIKSKVENDSDTIIICDYFTLAENRRISSFNVQGTEYTLQWHESNIEHVGPGMYNVITNDNPNFADGIRNWISGENGDEGVEINGRDEYDILMGTSHNDTISAGIKGGELYGNDGDDVLYGSDNYDYIVGGKGNDEIYLGNAYIDRDTIIFINPNGENPLAFGQDTVYDANLFDNLEFVYNTGEGYIGYHPADLTFEKSGTSLLIKADQNQVKLVNYYNRNGKVEKNAPYRLTLLNGGNEPASYYIEALMDPNSIDLTEYEYNELTFERDITGNNINDLVIKKGDNVVYTIENFFKQRKPIDWVLTADDTISIKDDADIQVITGNKDYTGTDYSEIVTSSPSDETYDLKTNEDEIIFSGNFGQDTVIVNNNENLNLTFNKDNIKWSASGKDVVLEDVANPDNKVTIKNYLAKEYKNTNVYFKTNLDEYAKNLRGVDFDPNVDGNKVTGTRLNETYLSTTYNEVIDLKTGDDAVGYEVTDDGNGNLIGWGNDTITVNKKESLDVDIIENFIVTKEEIQYEYDIQNKYTINGKNLIITSTAICTNPPEGYNTKYDLGSITLIGGANIDSSTELYINGENLSEGYIDYQTGEIITALHYDETDVTKSRTLNGTQLSDGIDLTNYISDKAKGVSIDTKGGNDIIFGSKYNDIIKSSSGDNRIEEYAGENKITTGKNDDQIVAEGTSSNTINAGDGRNWIWLVSSGVNKLTSGKDADFITATNGNNTIKAGDGSNFVKLQGGKNTVTTGKGRDDIIVSDPYLTGAQSVNVIKTGAGADTIQIETMSENTINAGDGGKNQYGENIGNKITLNNGINTVTSGKNADKVTISGGQNIVNSGAGDDNFTVSGGTSILDGSAGNDIYNVDITTFSDSMIINDVKGANVLNLGTANNQVNLFFDVEVSRNGKAVFSNMKFSIDNVIGPDGFSDLNGVDVANKKVISKLEYGNNSFDIESSEIDKLAADIANWLTSKPGYSSTNDVYASGNAGDIAQLTGAYTNFAANGYVYNDANSLMG